MSKRRMSKVLCPLISVLCLLAALNASASHREIDIKWKVGDSPDRKMNLEWFQGDSIGFNLTSKMNREPFVFATNDVLVWEVRGWIGDHTNLYAVATGTVVNAESGESRYELTVEQTANLPEGTCLGYVKAMQLDGTNLSERVVLGWQWINVEWSETSQDYEVTGALAKPYTTPAEVAAIEAALSNQVEGVRLEALGISNALAAADAVLQVDIDTRQPAATAATDAELAAAVSDAPNWTAAYAWGNHALAGYLTSYTETDPAFTAWDKDYADLINQPTIPTQYTDAMAEAALADELAAKANLADFQGLEASVAGSSNDWNTAFGWGNHALFGYLTSFTETDPAFTAWDKDYADLINQPTIPTQYTDAMAEAALADELAAKQDASTAATDAELQAVSNLAASAVQDSDSGDNIQIEAPGMFPYISLIPGVDGIVRAYGFFWSEHGISIGSDGDPDDPWEVGDMGFNDARYAPIAITNQAALVPQMAADVAVLNHNATNWFTANLTNSYVVVDGLIFDAQRFGFSGYNPG